MSQGRSNSLNKAESRIVTIPRRSHMKKHLPQGMLIRIREIQESNCAPQAHKIQSQTHKS